MDASWFMAFLRALVCCTLFSRLKTHLLWEVKGIALNLNLASKSFQAEHHRNAESLDFKHTSRVHKERSTLALTAIQSVVLLQTFDSVVQCSVSLFSGDKGTLARTRYHPSLQEHRGAPMGIRCRASTSTT